MPIASVVSDKPCKEKNGNDTVETGFNGKLSEKLLNKWWWKKMIKQKLVKFLLGDNFMLWNIKDYGDALEKKAENFMIIKGLIPYKDFWSEFIGNIGGQPARLEYPNDAVDNKRKLFGQWNYIILKNLYSIHWLQQKKYNKHKFNKHNLSDIIVYDRDFVLITHLTYNNIELLDKIHNLINNSNDEPYKNKFVDFINLRNTLSHNIKPLTKYEYCYMTPKNFVWFTTNGKNKEKLIWDENNFKELEYQPINDYFNWCINAVIDDFKTVLTDEYRYMNRLFKQNKLKIVDIPQSMVINMPKTTISGSTKQE